MRFFFDNNISPLLARAVNELDPQHEAVALRSKFAPDTPDVEWLNVLGAEGDWVVISGDLRISRSRHEKEAWLEAGLTAFFLAKGFANIPYWEQASVLVRWWPVVRQQAEIVKAGAGFLVPLRGMQLK